jgi:hypothetical protein
MEFDRVDDTQAHAICAEYRVSLPEHINKEALQHMVDVVLSEIELPSWVEPEHTLGYVHEIEDEPRKALVRLTLPTFLGKDNDEVWDSRMSAFEVIFRRGMHEQRKRYEAQT